MYAENLGLKLKSFIHNLFELYYIPYMHTWKKILNKDMKTAKQIVKGDIIWQYVFSNDNCYIERKITFYVKKYDVLNHTYAYMKKILLFFVSVYLFQPITFEPRRWCSGLERSPHKRKVGVFESQPRQT